MCWPDSSPLGWLPLLGRGGTQRLPTGWPFQQQPKTEIEIVGDGVFVEAPRRINGLAQQQLTIAPQLADAAMGPALWRDPALLEIPARTSGESRPEEVQLYEQF